MQTVPIMRFNFGFQMFVRTASEARNLDVLKFVTTTESVLEGLKQRTHGGRKE